MKTINDIKNAVLSGNRVFWKQDAYEVIKDSKNQWLIAYRQGERGENYVGLTHRDGIGSEYDPKDFYIKGKSVNMKIEDKFYGRRVVKGIFAKAKFASHPSWSEGILGKETDPKLAAYSWISKNNIESGRRQMLLADLAAGMYENNKSLSIAQAVLAAAKDMVRKGVATTEIQQWAGNGGKFARTGSKAKFAANQKAKFEIVKSGGQTFRIDHFDGDDFKLYMRIDGEFEFIKKLENPMSWIRAHAQPRDPQYWLPWAIKNSRTGVKAKFAKEYVMWGLPKGSTNRLDEKVMAEGLYTPAQVDDVKRRASAAGWHSFRVVPMMSFEDMTNAFKGKGIKKRSSRTGFKTKFSHLSTMLDMLDYQSANDQEDLAKKNIKGLAQSIGKLNPTKDEWSRYVKIAKSLGFSESQISGFSRTGSKAKFANGVYGNEEIAKGLSKVLKANGFDAMASEVLSGSTDSETLRKYIRALKSKLSPMSGNDRGMVLLQTLEKQLASRTGAKVFK